MADVVTDFANRTIEIKDKKLLTTEDEIDAELEIVVAWDNENKRFVFSFIDRKIKKS